MTHRILEPHERIQAGDSYRLEGTPDWRPAHQAIRLTVAQANRRQGFQGSEWRRPASKEKDPE